MSWSTRMLRFCGILHSSTTSKAALSFRRVTKKTRPCSSDRTRRSRYSRDPWPQSSRVQPEGIGQFDVAPFGFGEQHVGRKVVVMVQQDVGFDAAFGTPELGPREHR